MEEIEQNAEQPKRKSAEDKNLIFGLAIIIIFIAVFLGARNWLTEISNDDLNPTNNTASFQPKTNNSGAPTQVNGDPNTGVEISVNYEKEKSQNQSVFQLAFNTHTIDYSSYNFQENIVLKDIQNKEYKAVSVVKRGEGHHQSIEIIFPLVSSPFKLILKNLAGAPERMFNF
jgi:hypothetical protein